jgi:hypothetical protein
MFPPAMDFNKYEQCSGAGSITSPTPTFHHSSFQPLQTVTIMELPEEQDPLEEIPLAVPDP